MFREDPLLKVGAIAMTFALVLVIAAVVVSVVIRGGPERAGATERVTATKSSVDSPTRGESPADPWREGAGSQPSTEVPNDGSDLGLWGGRSKSGSTPTDGAEPGSQSEQLSQPGSQSRGASSSESGPQGQAGSGSGPGTSGRAEPKTGFGTNARPETDTRPGTNEQSGTDARSGMSARPETNERAGTNARPASEPGQGTLPAGETDWSRPTPKEIEAANGPRHYDMPPGAIMSLTIDSIGIYGAPVFDSASEVALANGISHLPDTSLPWSDTPQRNVYLAGHRMGFRGTWSRMLFYNLDDVERGDKVVLKDRAGHTYEYRVSEVFLVGPYDSWVTGQVRGRDMVTLQTCTPIPTFEKRLIVRADRL